MDVRKLDGFKQLYGDDDLVNQSGERHGVAMVRDATVEGAHHRASGERNGLKRETYALALACIQLTAHLRANSHYELASQFVRSGTAPGALVAEYFFAESRRDAHHKLAIAQKEANECKYWACLLRDSQLLPQSDIDSVVAQADKVLRVLQIFKSKIAP